MASSGAKVAGPAEPGAPSALLKDRFEIGDVLGNLAFPGAAAHAARDRGDGARAVMALVCDPNLPPYQDGLQYLKGFQVPNFTKLVDFGVIPWLPTSDHRLVLIVERPPAPRLMASLAKPFKPWSEADVLNCLLRPMVETLAMFGTACLVHGGIRPTNLFRAEGENTPVMLGDCVSAPPHFHQPAAFCSIPLMQAEPIGRGLGAAGDDIYALAVTMLTLLLGHDPAEGRDDAALRREKIERGSYAALCGQRQLPSGLRVPLRGMLEDRIEARWTLADLRIWTVEHRVRTGHHGNPQQAARFFEIGGEAFPRPEPLGQWLADNWDKVKLPEHGHEILIWAERGLGDAKVGDTVRSAMEASRRDGAPDSAEHAAFIARLAMALDPAAPIRYRGRAFHMDGFGALLAQSLSDDAKAKVLAETMTQNLLDFRMRTLANPEHVKAATLRAVDQGARALKKSGLGFGIERCLYEINPFTRCRSPLIENAGVFAVADLLPALDRASAKGHSGPPLDRHIAAFAASRLKVDVGSFLSAADNRKDATAAAMGLLGLLATLQVQTGGRSFPGLARWLAKHLAPAVDSFHNTENREKARAELAELTEGGDLAAIFRYFADGELRARDRDGFARATVEYARLANDIAGLRGKSADDLQRRQTYGRQIAAGLAGVLCLLSIAAAGLTMW